MEVMTVCIEELLVEASEVRLTPPEYKPLLVLVRKAGKVVTDRQLFKEVRGPSYAAPIQYPRCVSVSLLVGSPSDSI